MRKQTPSIYPYLLSSVLLLCSAGSGFAQSATFAYQGRLTEAGNPASGTFETRFRLFDTPDVGTGTQQGPAINLPDVLAKDGVFTVLLDFEVTVFDGSPRFLEIAVKKASTANTLSTLSPRQAITPVPYAIRTLSATPVPGGVQADASGNVAVGTNTFPPGVRLNVNGPTRISPGGTGGFMQIGTPGGETGLSILGDNRFDLRFNGQTVALAAGSNTGPTPYENGIILNTSGNVGIGMSSPFPASQWKLEINGPTRMTPGGGSGGAIQFSTPNRETGMSILGANRADLRFDDSTLKLVAGPGNGTPGNASGVAITTSGSVGIGTTTPRGALHVASGGVAVTGSSSPYLGAGSGLFMESGGTQGGLLFAYDYSAGAARNLLLNSPGGNVGIGTTNPVAKFHVAAASDNGTALRADGNAAQALRSWK